MSKWMLASMVGVVVSQAGEFRNLDLQQVNTGSSLQLLSPSKWIGAATNLIPSWTVSINGIATNSVGFSDVGSVAAPGITVVRSLSGVGYTLLFVPNGTGPNGEFSSLVAITQRGTIPMDTKWITFDNPIESNGPVVSINSLEIGYAAGREGLDVSKFAGQTVDLSISSRFFIGISRVSFVSVPEPSAGGLLVFAGLAWGVLGWKPRKR